MLTSCSFHCKTPKPAACNLTPALQHQPRQEPNCTCSYDEGIVTGKEGQAECWCGDAEPSSGKVPHFLWSLPRQFLSPQGFASVGVWNFHACDPPETLLRKDRADMVTLPLHCLISLLEVMLLVPLTYWYMCVYTSEVWESP